ncbi:hypothetical protein [Ramlibacter sp.]|nr:hypothetical protein [Ramlibacter sp.]
MTPGTGAGAQPEAWTTVGGRAGITRLGGNRWSVASTAPAANPSRGTPY